MQYQHEIHKQILSHLLPKSMCILHPKKRKKNPNHLCDCVLQSHNKMTLNWCPISIFYYFYSSLFFLCVGWLMLDSNVASLPQLPWDFLVIVVLVPYKAQTQKRWDVRCIHLNYRRHMKKWDILKDFQGDING
jgi:hypothetical protein